MPETVVGNAMGSQTGRYVVSYEGFRIPLLVFNLGEVLSRQRWSSAFHASTRGKWGKIPILFGLALHQLNDHGKQTIASLNSYSGTSDIANHDVDTGSRRPKIHGRHGAELW